MRCFAFVFAWLCALFASACSEDGVGKEGTLVGGPCAFTADCNEEEGSFCLSDESFPAGTCAVRCTNHQECPDGTRCVNKNTGICLLSCAGPADCRTGYACESLNDQEGGATSPVCIAPPNQ